jgi:hypothetical protein
VGRIKHALYSAALRAGYEIGPRWDDWRRLPLLAPTAGTIVDVGVGDGTPYLYEAYPDADLLLIEPLAEFDEPIANILRERRGSSHRVGVGSREGRSSVHVTLHPERSSIHSLADLADGADDRCARHPNQDPRLADR